jgi:predicted TPR repeat methyltransferase
MSKDPNELTLEAYNASVQSYLEYTPASYGTPHAELKKWIDNALAYTKPQGNILEIGSATPRDAMYIRSKGFTVQCSDATENFVKLLNKSGENAIPLNIIHQHTDPMYDMVFANAVFPHFNQEDTASALKNIHSSLLPGGILTFNVKQGEEDEWVSEKNTQPRYIHYWQPHEIYDEVVTAGFEVIEIEDGIEGDLPTHIWTRIIAQKSDS